MSELDVVKELAKRALTVPTSTNDHDNFLWDRTQRLVRNAEYICRLPELSKADVQIDHFCLMAAIYFSGVGLARSLEAKQTGTKVTRDKGNSEDLLDFSAEVAAKELTGVVGEAKIKKIKKIITESSSNFTQMTEAMILSDAHNLDDMGAAGILNEFRRFASHGKGFPHVLQNWKKKVDYQYWQARLKKNFHFGQVRKLAERRLTAAGHFMSQLRVETEAEDLEKLAFKLQESKEKVPVAEFVKKQEKLSYR